jgi:hypothetical protein
MSKVSAVLAVEEILVKHEGASNHQWHNVSFEYATWLRPMQGGGFVEQQTGACNVCPKGTPIPSEGWCAQQGPFLEIPFHILNTGVDGVQTHRFAKTGSGQTEGKLKKRAPLFAVA